MKLLGNTSASSTDANTNLDEPKRGDDSLLLLLDETIGTMMLKIEFNNVLKFIECVYLSVLCRSWTRDPQPLCPQSHLGRGIPYPTDGSSKRSSTVPKRDVTVRR